MKKILFAINTLGTGGAEKAMISLLKRLSQEEVEIELEVILNQGELIKELPQKVKLINQKFDSTPVTGVKGEWHLFKNSIKIGFCRGAIIRNLPYMIKNFFYMLKKGLINKDKLLWQALALGADRSPKEYDLAIAFTEGAATYYVSRYARASRKVAFVHVSYEEAGYYPKLDKACYEGMNKIFCVSGEVRENFLKVYPGLESITEVFNNILDLDEINRKAQAQEGFDDDFDGFRILTVGRLSRQKSVELAIETLDELLKRNVNARWYVLGDGRQRRHLEKMIKSRKLEDKFFILGIKSNPFPYIKECGIFVNVSSFEGKSIAIQEAQLLAKAVVATGCPGNIEQISDGYDGFLCDMNAKSLCKAIEKLYSDADLRLKMGQRAKKKVFDQITDKDEVSEIIGLMQ